MTASVLAWVVVIALLEILGYLPELVADARGKLVVPHVSVPDPKP